MERQDFRDLTRIEVRWAEVDAQKVVFNAHYLAYADVAFSHYLRRLALPYDAAFARLGGELFARKASTSLLQRKLRIGYARAARIIEEMEEQGIIGAADGSRPRDVLISSMDDLDGASTDV